MNNNEFNLLDEPWIPVADYGAVSLRDIFSTTKFFSLGGTPVQKIALLKLFLAISQSAWTPRNEKEWESMDLETFCKKVLDYLDKWFDSFWLYGKKPFLQFPAVLKAEKKTFGTILSMISTGNTTVLNQSQIEVKLTDAEKALALIEQMAFSLGGKKTDNSIILTLGYKEKSNDKGRPSSGKPGPGVAFKGLLHSFVFGANILESIFLNIFTEDTILNLQMFPEGKGIAPWEKMPKGEDDEVARKFKNSYMGRLIPLSRFIFINGEVLHNTEGIFHKNYLDGIVDPTVAADFSKKKPLVIWADPEKKPWRQVPALLSFMQEEIGSYTCAQLKVVMPRLHKKDSFTVWSGGMKVSSNAGEQYLSGIDDFVESEVQFSSAIFDDAAEFITNINSEMKTMDDVSRFLWGRINGYYKELNMDGKNIAGKATNEYWQLCERVFQDIVNYYSEINTNNEDFSNSYFKFASVIYDKYCANQSARQMEAWAKNKFGSKANKGEK